MYLSQYAASASHTPLLIARLLIFLAMGVAIILTRLRVFRPRYDRLVAKGLDLLLEGKPVEAEKCYRTALDLVPESARVRVLVCLGDALIDQRRYEDAKQYLAEAIESGDPFGSAQGSMCDVLLAQKASLEKVIEMGDTAMQLQSRAAATQAFGQSWAALSNDLLEARTWARKAQALRLLDRPEEARQAVDRALKILNSSQAELQQVQPEASLMAKLILGNRLRRLKLLTISDTYWQVGLSLLAIGDKAKAADQFRVVCSTDPMGKYRSLAQEKLDSLGYMSATA